MSKSCKFVSLAKLFLRFPLFEGFLLVSLERHYIIFGLFLGKRGCGMLVFPETRK